MFPYSQKRHLWGLGLLGVILLAECRQEQDPVAGFTQVSGYARDAATGQPVPGALVELMERYVGSRSASLSIGSSDCALHFDSVRADANGYFTFGFDAKGDYTYHLRGTRHDYLSLDFFDFCQPRRMPMVAKGRRTTTDAPLMPVGFVRIHAIDDPAISQFTAGSVSEDYLSLGASGKYLTQRFVFGRNTGHPYAPDTTQVFTCKWYPAWYPVGNTRTFYWYAWGGANVGSSAIAQQLTLLAHDTIDWEIRY